MRAGAFCAVGFRHPGRDIFVLRTETESPGDYRQLYGGMESGHSASRATPAFASLHIYSRPVQPLSSSDDVSSFTVGPTRPGICAGMLFVWIVATPIAKARKWQGLVIRAGAVPVRTMSYELPILVLSLAVNG